MYLIILVLENLSEKTKLLIGWHSDGFQSGRYRVKMATGVGKWIPKQGMSVFERMNI